LRVRPPVGLIYDLAGHIVLDSDEGVQQAVRLAFAVFDQTGSALAVVKHFALHHLRFPVRHWGGTQDGELEWVPLRHTRVLDVLHNPAYTGAYVYGRTETRSHSLPGEPPRIKGYQRRLAQDQWSVLLPEAHPGYISWMM
jgi:hypothetical protein